MNLQKQMTNLVERAQTLIREYGSDCHHKVCCQLADEFHLWALATSPGFGFSRRSSWGWKRRKQQRGRGF